MAPRKKADPKPAEPDPVAADDLEGDDFAELLGKVQEATSEETDEAASRDDDEGGAEAETEEATSEAEKGKPADEPQAVKDARAAQAAADQRAARLEADLRRLQQAQAEREEREAEERRKTEDEEFERLREEDPDALLDRIARERREAKAERQSQGTAFDLRDQQMVRMAVEHTDKLFPGLERADVLDALAQANEMTKAEGRRPYPAEIYAVLGDIRLGKAVADKDTRIAQLEAELEAEKAGRTADILDDEDGPDNPADGAPAVRIDLENIDSLPDDDAWWDANESRVLAQEKKRIGR
jgi:hypothetical protein